MGEWIRFWITAVLLTISVVSFAAAVTGAWRFGFVMNRIHSAGIGDTLGLFAVTAALILATGFSFDTLKLALLVLFLWFTAPVSSHFLGQVEFFTNPHPEDELKWEGTLTEEDGRPDRDRKQ